MKKTSRKTAAKTVKSSRPVKSNLAASELRHYKELLLARRKIILGDVNQMEDGALKGGDGERIVAYEHPADLSTQNYEQEFLLGIIQNEEEELRDIDQALERIKSSVFGICEGCQKKIPKARLKAIPYARLCVACKRKEELGEETEEK